MKSCGAPERVKVKQRCQMVLQQYWYLSPLRHFSHRLFAQSKKKFEPVTKDIILQKRHDQFRMKINSTKELLLIIIWWIQKLCSSSFIIKYCSSCLGSEHFLRQKTTKMSIRLKYVTREGSWFFSHRHSRHLTTEVLVKCPCSKDSQEPNDMGR